MVKVFGFMLALAAMVSSASAALLPLLEYDYNSGKNASFAKPGMLSAADGSVGAFGYSGSDARATQTSSGSTTTRNSNEQFFLSTDASSLATITSMTFEGSVISGTRTQVWTAAFNLGTPTGDGLNASPPGDGFVAGTSITGAISGPGPNNTYTVTFATPIALSPANILRATINAAGTGTTATVVALDNVRFFGTVVPEPASMAVFGLLGAGVAVRRLRRKV